jgi:Zn ribbon nucleic-acid-binding protein
MYCKGELEILLDKGFTKKVKCVSCGFTNSPEPKEPEVVVIRRRQSA